MFYSSLLDREVGADFERLGQTGFFHLVGEIFDGDGVELAHQIGMNALDHRADDTVAESKARGTTAFVVSKLERKLHIYKKGILTASYDIGLGRFGLSDKMFSGDEATPEGRYKIIRIGVESVEMSYLDGRGRQRIPLTG